MYLFKGCELFAPEMMGRKDVFVAGGKVCAIADHLDAPKNWEIEVIEADGLMMTPGLIDGHVHIAGAGGEGGPATRTPEVALSAFWKGGVTSAVGCLGTDGFTRNIEGLLMKAKGLRQGGLNCWIYSGSYQVPTPTIFKDPACDLCYIDEIIGLGEIAIADHRSSQPSIQELARMAKHTRIGGLLSGKAGIIHLHMGDDLQPFRLLYQVAEQTGISPTHFYPTHINRNKHIFEDAKAFGKVGYLDFTTSSYRYFPDEEVKPSSGLRALLEAGVPLANVTLSSDAGGSLPKFGADGRLERMEVGEPSATLLEVRDMVLEEGLSLPQALATVTANPARILKLKGKGQLKVGCDADLLLLNSDFAPLYLLAGGELVVREGKLLRKGPFER